MTSITVTAARWSGGWELEIDADHHTAVRHLEDAPQQVIDYLDTLDDTTDHSGWTVNIVPDIGELADEVRSTRDATRAAAAAQQEAAARSRRTARKLRAAGHSVSDTAAILGVSRGRVSQLTRS